MTKVTPARILATIPYLRTLPAAEVAVLARRCLVRRYARGDEIFAEGMPGAGLHAIIEGRVALLRVSARGREQVLHTEGAGATLGEVPVFDGGDYLASAIAREDTRVLFIPREALYEVCRRRPEVALGVIAVLARRLRGFAALIEDLSLRDVTARVARFLNEAADGRNSAFQLPGTREEIGTRLGTVRELISRSLAGLEAAGVIELRGRRVRVLDRRRLAALAGLTPSR